MAFTDENGGIGATMLVSPTNGNGGGFGNGFGGDSWAWIILLLLLGWGNNGGGFGGGFGGSGGDYPWLANGQQNIMTNTNNGFRDAMINDGITSIRDGISSLSTQLCNCCSDTQMALANGFAGVEQGANARQIANMQTAFAGQTAMNQGFNAVQSQLAQCCCDNRLATCQTQNIVQNEANATRFADANNTRDIIQSQADGTRAILDKLCSLELEAKNDTIAQLRSELLYARGQASQDVQTARILAGQVAETDAIYNRLNECPVGTTPVFGRTPIFQCNGGCGCSGNTFIN